MEDGLRTAHDIDAALRTVAFGADGRVSDWRVRPNSGCAGGDFAIDHARRSDASCRAADSPDIEHRSGARLHARSLFHHDTNVRILAGEIGAKIDVPSFTLTSSRGAPVR